MKYKTNPEWEVIPDNGPYFVPLCGEFKSAQMKYKSVTELAADNPNLGEYLAQLEKQQAILQARIKELVEELRIATGRCKVCGETRSPHCVTCD